MFSGALLVKHTHTLTKNRPEKIRNNKRDNKCDTQHTKATAKQKKMKNTKPNEFVCLEHTLCSNYTNSEEETDSDCEEDEHEAY